MIYIINIFLIVSWIVFSIYEGKREAWFFHKGGVKLKRDIHFYFSVQRISVGIAFLVALTSTEISWYNLLDVVLTSIMLIIVFPFWHGGYYYLERNNLNPTIYKKRFKDFNNSSAIFDFTWNERLIMFMVGIMIIIHIKRFRKLLNITMLITRGILNQ